jgi:hypothetical protein
MLVAYQRAVLLSKSKVPIAAYGSSRHVTALNASYEALHASRRAPETKVNHTFSNNTRLAAMLSKREKRNESDAKFFVRHP